VSSRTSPGRDRIWLPERWRRLELTGSKRERFLTGLMKLLMVRRGAGLERDSAA
jgi:hypothetical protein